MLPIDPQRMLEDLRALAEFGKLGTGVNRRSLTPEDLAARDWLLERMQAAGLDARISTESAAWPGRTPGSRRHILIGSHTDSVPKGGWLDGSMGVMFGLEIARAWVEDGRSDDLGVEVISFIDEEGRFAGLLGSAAFTGKMAEADIGKLTDERGESLESALQAAGYAGRDLLRCEPARHAAYLEAHIEQGPVLETAGKRIGLVTDIVGVARCEVIFTGQADHAGTTPMGLRRDAAAALYAFADDFSRFCSEEGKRQDCLEPGDRGHGPGRLQRGDPPGPPGRRVSRSVGGRARTHPEIYRRKRPGRVAKRHRVSAEVVAGAGILSQSRWTNPSCATWSRPPATWAHPACECPAAPDTTPRCSRH